MLHTYVTNWYEQRSVGDRGLYINASWLMGWVVLLSLFRTELPHSWAIVLLGWKGIRVHVPPPLLSLK